MPFLAALTGILTGEVGRWGTRLIDVWAAGKEHDREVEKLKLAHEQNVKLEDVKNFGKALYVENGQIALSDKLSTGFLNILSCFTVGVEVLTKLVRPVVTAAAIGLLVYMFSNANEALRVALTEEIVFTSCAIIRYWFGYREDSRKSKK